MLVEKSRTLPELQQLRVEPYHRCALYIRRLPLNGGEYKRWQYVTDKVGWIRRIFAAQLESRIQEKAKKLKKYKKNISDVRLLLVSNKIFNSGKTKLEEKKGVKLFGFDEVYYLSYPDQITRLKNL